jgi:hypothetical protein
MVSDERTPNAAAADAAAVIERISVDLALSEEPAGFLAALEELAGDE